MRENTSTVEHPEFLNKTGVGDLSKVAVSLHPSLAVLYDGDPTLGWEGDVRLCMYHGPEARYYLYRLEHDEQYRLVCRSEPFGLGMMTYQGIQKLVKELMTRDARRGFDPLSTIAQNDAIDVANRKEFTDIVSEEVVPRMKHWASRAYIPGVDIRPRLR